MIQKLVIFASGKGSNTQKIIDYFRDSTVASISLIVSNKADAGVLEIAQKEAIPSLIISKAQLNDAGFILEKLHDFQPDWIILAGFLLKIPTFLTQEFPNRIINIHPALLPKFGGKGMYGARVHQAVIEAGEKESGITIHLVNEHYDQGEIILQKKCNVLPSDDADSLAEKIHTLEHHWLPRTIENLIHKG